MTVRESDVNVMEVGRGLPAVCYIPRDDYSVRPIYL